MTEPSAFNVDVTDYKDTILMQTGYGNAIIPAEYQLKPLWTTKY